MRTYTEAHAEGMKAVRQKPLHAPACPYDEDREPDAHNGWTDGAIEAGIGEIYTNGMLDEEHRQRPAHRRSAKPANKPKERKEA